MGTEAAEQHRLDEAQAKRAAWKKRRPCLSERQWGTVREDYRDNGDAWNYFTHDQARSFHEYFHDETGAGIGASHQTGWTGCMARIMQTNAVLTKDLLLMPGADAAAARALHGVAQDATAARTTTSG